MRNAPNVKANRFRIRHGELGSGDWYGNNGAFLVPVGKETLAVIVSDGQESETDPPCLWEHVSVSLNDRCPTWEEMCFVKDLFFREDEVVMQLHPAKKDYVNWHPYCLHLWRPTTTTIPLPPAWAVGPQTAPA